MSDTYWLRRNDLGPQVEVSISEERYKTLRQARETLVDAGAFEHKYELLLSNFLVLEEFCTEWSLRGELEFDHRYETWAKVILEANRHVMNLLSAGRAFTDQIVRDFRHLDLTPAFHEEATRLMHEAYDRSFGYRFACALRNYVQHSAPPVHRITSGDRETHWAEKLEIYCSKDQLDKRNFKTAVYDEAGQQTNIRQITREFMLEVSLVHQDLRELAKEACNNARRAHEEAIKEFSAAQDEAPSNGRPEIGLSICRRRDDNIFDVIPILLDWDNVRIHLSSKNRYALKLFAPTRP